MKFVGRKKELASLYQHYQTNKFQFAVIYGRRRIGKTALINEFLKDKKAIYFTAIEENKEDNLRRFLSFGFSLIKCDQHKEKELILKTHFDCLGL